MKRNKTWFSLGLVALSALALTLILMVLPAGATHSDPVRGVVTVDPEVVSPDNAIDIGDRTITITVTDTNMNRVLFVGEGPDGETETFPKGMVTISPQGPGTVLKTLSPITDSATNETFMAIADRNDDGLIDRNDIELVDIPNGVSVAVDSIFDADRGRVYFSVFETIDSAVSFGVEYATSGQELTRATGTISETVTHTVADNMLSAGDPVTLTLNQDHLPLQDTNGDGVVNGEDITISIDGRSDSDTPGLDDAGIGDIGKITDDERDGFPHSSEITLVYKGADLAIDETIDINVTYLGLEDLVKVKGARGENMPLRLLETGANTGIFEATVVVFNGANNEDNMDMDTNLEPSEIRDDQRPRLAVIDGGSVTVTYGDRSPRRTITARVKVESEPPSFSNTMPANNTSTNNLDTVLTTEVVDNIAGVDSSEVTVMIKVDGVGVAESDVSGDISVQETFEGSGVYTVGYNINNIDAIDDAKTDETAVDVEIEWNVKVKDKAGNESLITDTIADTTELTLNVNTYPPALSNAFSGDNWDADADDPDTEDVDERLRGSRDGLLGPDVRTSIRVEFDRDMKGSSLQASDFRVDGVAPTGVDHFSDMADSVFLTVPELAPDATPKIEVVGEVEDVGGNAVDVDDSEASVLESAKDGIAPKLKVDVVDPYTDGDIELLVESDEPITGSLPQRTIKMCVKQEDSTLMCTGAEPSVSTSSRIVRDQREWSFSVTGFAAGRYGLVVNAEDVAGNASMTGSEDPTDTGAITFEIDKELPVAGATDPAGKDDEKSEAEPFVIEIDWTSEDEYDGDSHTDVTLSKAVLNAGEDNEQDVLALSSTRDNRSFSIAISDIGVGEHTLTYNGMDEMGHTREDDTVLTFTVVAPTPFNLTLTPGMNLVSVPRDPGNTDIQDVFGDVEEITLVFTRPFAGESDLPWLIAIRDQMTGEFVGDLKFIDARHAYWVKASATRSVEIQTPPLQAQRIPPTIPVKAGEWSLVPVISLAPIAADTSNGSTADIQEGTEFDVNSYFGKDNWSKAFTFDRGQWIGITPAQEDGAPDDVVTTLDDAAQIGRGYWVLFTEDGNITPGIKR